MQIKLTEQQQNEVGLKWLDDQLNTAEGAQFVLKRLFAAARHSNWCWDDALAYAVTQCSDMYLVNFGDVLEMLEPTKRIP